MTFNYETEGVGLDRSVTTLLPSERFPLHYCLYATVLTLHCTY
jgi:hypothetical protein